MDTQQDQHETRINYYHWCKGVTMVLLCLWVGCACCHANLVGAHQHDVDSVTGEGGFGCTLWSFGWPVSYANGNSAAPFSGAYLSTTGIGCLVADLFIFAVLIAAVVGVFHGRRSGHEQRWQFTLSDLFSLTTATAALFAMFASERTCYRAGPAYAWEAGVYAPLSAYPWYDQVPIGISIVCGVLCVLRVFRSDRGRLDSGDT